MPRENNDPTYLARMQDYYARHRVLPSYTGIATLLGLASKGATARMVQRLKERGYLDAAAGGRLIPGAKFFERTRAAEYVQAGFPSPATDALQDALSIDQYLVENPSGTVLVTVKGDSMIDAGIHPGDIAIVEKRSDARKGDIVVAIVENDFTLKYLARDRKGFYLRPD